eukprot:COSAG02_NODE_32751_length_511_cov_0.958738_1_plen_79_part_10
MQKQFNGQIPNAEHAGCEKCEVGTEPNAKRSACSPCPPGQVAAVGETCHRCHCLVGSVASLQVGMCRLLLGRDPTVPVG